MGNKEQYYKLLTSYRSLWVNRSLADETEEPETVLKNAIQKDLLDEMTHPRVRKDPYIKMYWATKRIVESNISPEDKLGLLSNYIQIMEQILQENQ
jgi:hypothetical protein